MNDFFKLQLKIRYADWSYIIQGFIVYFLLSIIGYILFSEGVFQYFLVFISVLFLILTAVHFNNIRSESLQHFQYKVQAINELTTLLPIRAPLPAMIGWAATPELALNVYKIIEVEKPNKIVELGSGVSTIIAAYSLEKFNPDGRIISFDHDSDFALKTRKEISYHQLGSFVNICDSPLKDMRLNGKKCIWYDIVFQEDGKPIDLLIVDGPPCKTQNNARYPALPFFNSKLADNAVIIFHDTNRDTESKTVEKWLKEFPEFSFSTLSTEKGITILKKSEPPLFIAG